MLAFFSLIRSRNLIILLLILYLLRFAVFFPILKVNNLPLQLSELEFFLLSFSFLFIAAAGYIINDITDYDTDIKNPLKKVKITRKISKTTASKFYYILTIIGIILGGILAILTKLYWQSLIFVVLPIILWLYSKKWQKQFLIGNLTIAFVAALVPILSVLFEYPLMVQNYTLPPVYYNIIVYWVIAYAIFSFIITLIREIVKDLADREYDHLDHQKTLAIQLKPLYSKLIITSLLLLCIFLLMYIYYNFLNTEQDNVTFNYFVVALIVPMIYFIYLLIYAQSPNDYHWLSGLLKTIMIMGILYMFVANYIINKIFL